MCSSPLNMSSVDLLGPFKLEIYMLIMEKRFSKPPQITSLK